MSEEACVYEREHVVEEEGGNVVGEECGLVGE
jgi:hypothetical protein